MALLLCPSVALAQSPADGAKRGSRGGQRGGYADPSLIIAAELAYNRQAVEKGQWTALGQIVAKDALLFKPQPVFAERWLNGQRNPPVPVRWQTRQVYMACDGSSAVSTGTWLPTGAADGAGRGWFTNIWRREKKGGYRLILSHDGPLTTAESVRGEDELEAMTARIATCAKRGRFGSAAGPSRDASPDLTPAVVPLDPKQPVPMKRQDRSDDGSLRWHWAVTPTGSRVLQAWMTTEEGEVSILTDRAGPAMP